MLVHEAAGEVSAVDRCGICDGFPELGESRRTIASFWAVLRAATFWLSRSAYLR